MKLQELLPKSGLPAAVNYVSPDKCWSFGDSKECFRSHGGHPLYDETSIRYSLNSLGYRCPEFTEDGAIRIISIGCSYVFGVGLPQTALFHELFAERLRQELGTTVVNWNLGVGAASNNYIARLLHLAVPLLQPDFVLIFFTHLARREYVTAHNCYVKYHPQLQTNDPVLREVGAHLGALSSQYQDQLDFFRDYKSVESLLAERLWLFSVVKPSELCDIVPHLDSTRRTPDHTWMDVARDHAHPGPATHESIYQCFWSRFVALDGLNRLRQKIRTAMICDR